MILNLSMSGKMICEPASSVIWVWIIWGSLWNIPISVGILSRSPNMIKIFLSPLYSLLSIFDFSINSKVWYEIVSWCSIFLFPCCIQFMPFLFLSIFDAVLSIQNFMVNSKIWDKVVSWVQWILFLSKISSHLFS